MQKWKKCNIEQTLPGLPEQVQDNQEEEKAEESKGDGFTVYPEVLDKLQTQIF